MEKIEVQNCTTTKLLNQNKMKIQEEFYNQQNGTTFYNQYFETQTNKPLNAADYFILLEKINQAIDLIMDDKEIELTIKIIKQNE